MAPVKCAQCGAMIDPLALACPYCRFTTPAGVAARQREEHERHSHAQWHAQAQYQHQVVENRRIESSAMQSLVWSLVGTFLCCAPLGIVGIVMGMRARTIATMAKVPVPGKATVGLVLGIVSTLSSIGFFIFAIISSQMEEAKTKERIASVEKRLGDKPAAKALDHDTACGLAEVYALRNGWSGTTGPYLTDFECVGKLSAEKERGELEDFRFKTSSGSKQNDVYVCFKRGGKWYVSEMRQTSCQASLPDDDDGGE